jgi:hypothetical protein
MYDLDVPEDDSFEMQRFLLKLSRKAIAEKLGIAEETLRKRIDNPDEFTLGNIKVLLELGFKFQI